MLVIKKNLISDLTSLSKPVALDINAFEIEVNVDIEKDDFEEMKNYSTFLQECHDTIQEDVLKSIVTETAKELGRFDRAYYAATRLKLDSEAKKWKGAADKLLKQAAVDIQEGVEHVISTAWQRILKLEKNVRKAKIKATIHIVLSCVALGLSIASLATTPITAVGAVAGAVGILAAVGSILKNLRDLGVKLPSLMQDIQKAFIKYRKKAEELQKKFEQEQDKAEKAEKRSAKANEAVKVGISGLTGGLSDIIISKLSGALPSHDAIKSDVDLFEVKIDELEISQKKLSQELNKLLDKSSDLIAHYELLETQFNEYLSDLSSKGAKCPPKVLESQAKIIMPKKRKAMEYERDTKNAIKKIEEVRGDVKAYRTVHKDFKERIDELIRIHKTETIALFTKIVVCLGSIALGGAAGNWDKAGDVVQNVYGIGSSLFDPVSDTVIDKL